MKTEIVIATRNKKKLKEIKRIFKHPGIKVLSLESFPEAPKVIEDKKTFKANAAKKAVVVSRRIGRIVLADDSGLAVRYLGGAPGVRSARYSGSKKSDKDNNAKLLRAMEGVPLKKRRACFKCAVAVADRGKLIRAAEGACCGLIGFKAEGRSGFGYDPLFIPTGYKRSFAALGIRIKDRLSHRSKALKKAKGIIEGYLRGYPGYFS